MEAILLARGHFPVSPGEIADAVIINTCAVTAESGRKSRQLIRRLQDGNRAEEQTKPEHVTPITRFEDTPEYKAFAERQRKLIEKQRKQEQKEKKPKRESIFDQIKRMRDKLTDMINEND